MNTDSPEYRLVIIHHMSDSFENIFHRNLCPSVKQANTSCVLESIIAFNDNIAFLSFWYLVEKWTGIDFSL